MRVCTRVDLQERVGRVVVTRREQGWLTHNGEGVRVVEIFFRRRTGKNILEGGKSMGGGGSKKVHDPFEEVQVPAHSWGDAELGEG